MSAKTSRWFNLAQDGDPTLPGWYDVKYRGRGDVHYKRRYFDGEQWRFTPEAGPTLFGNTASDRRYEHWRGLAKKPRAAKDETVGGIK